MNAAPLDPRTVGGPVWVVAPHPDDEALGCGALLAALGDLGTECWALLITDGGFSHPHSPSHPRLVLAAARHAEWQAGLGRLGLPAGRTRALNLPDGALDLEPAAGVQAQVAAAFAAAPPATVLLPWRRDSHPDHRATWAPVVAAAGARLLGYSVWLDERGEAADWPQPGEARTWAFETGQWRERKAQAIGCHRTQLGALSDDPDGFLLDPAMVQRALSGPERYFEPLSPEACR